MKIISNYFNFKSTPYKAIKNNNFINNSLVKSPIKDTVLFTGGIDDYEHVETVFESFEKQFSVPHSDANKYRECEIWAAKAAIDIEDKELRNNVLFEGAYGCIVNGRDDFRRNTGDRILMDVLAGGLLYIEPQIAHWKKEAKKLVPKLELIRKDLISARTNEKAAELKIQQQRTQREVECIQKLNDLKINELCPNFIDKLEAVSTGKDVEMPNCILLSGSKGLNDDIIKWCSYVADCEYDEYDANDEDFDLIDILETAQEYYEENETWNLIYINNMETLINQDSEEAVVAIMKDIMCSTAKDYHTTLIFQTQDISKLDDIAIQPNRVKIIDTSEIKSPEKIEIEDAKKRLEDDNYVKGTPICALNDILFLTGEKINKLTFENDCFKYFDFMKMILHKHPEFKERADIAMSNCWYIPDLSSNYRKIKNNPPDYISFFDLEEIEG